MFAHQIMNIKYTLNQECFEGVYGCDHNLTRVPSLNYGHFIQIFHLFYQINANLTRDAALIFSYSWKEHKQWYVVRFTHPP